MRSNDASGPVAIVGGGLSGLTAAFELVSAGRRVELFESSRRLGGQIHTEHAHGYLIEHGAEGFVARSATLQALAERLGIGEALVGQALERSFGWDAGALTSLAPGEAAAFLGFQVPSAELGKGIRTFARGMGQITDALIAACVPHAAMHTEAQVERLVVTERGVRVELTSGAVMDAAQVLLATGAVHAADLLEPIVGAAASELRASATLSSLTVSFGVPRSGVAHALDGTGFVVRHPDAHEGLRACTFTSSKFAGRAPAGCVSLRAFFRPTSAELSTLDDAAWQARTARQLAAIVGLSAAPERSWVSRWASALPVHDPAHAQRIATLEAQLETLPIRLVGAAFHGSGIDAAVRSAERMVATL